MIIAFDPKVKNKPKKMLELLKEVRALQPKYQKKILKSIFIFFIKLTRGHSSAFLIRIGIIVYSKIKKINIMAEWD